MLGSPGENGVSRDHPDGALLVVVVVSGALALIVKKHLKARTDSILLVIGDLEMFKGANQYFQEEDSLTY